VRTFEPTFVQANRQRCWVACYGREDDLREYDRLYPKALTDALSFVLPLVTGLAGLYVHCWARPGEQRSSP
jgi:hypothetical protein